MTAIPISDVLGPTTSSSWLAGFKLSSRAALSRYLRTGSWDGKSNRRPLDEVVRPVDGLLNHLGLRRPPRDNCTRKQSSHHDKQDSSSQNPPLTRQRIRHDRKAGSSSAEEEFREQPEDRHRIHGRGDGKQ